MTDEHSGVSKMEGNGSFRHYDSEWQRSCKDRLIKHVVRRFRHDANAVDGTGHPELQRKYAFLMPELAARLRMLDDSGTARRLSDRLDGSSVTPEDRELLRMVLPQYDVLERIGSGGQGVVYSATRCADQTRVAIKVLREGPYTTIRQRSRFEREVTLVGRLSHPHIVKLIESRISIYRPAIVMEFVNGCPIDDYVLLERPDVWQLARILESVCRAVHHAHAKGVIHRDLKPTNILVDERGEPRLLDFGLACGECDGYTTTSSSHVMLGSLPFMSPEQVSGRSTDVDVRTDVYSLGIVMYRVLTGTMPYETNGPSDVVCARICNSEPIRPRSTTRSEQFPGLPSTLVIPKDLEAIALKALSKDPEARYQSADAMAEDLRRFINREPIQAPSLGAFYGLSKAFRAHRATALTACVALILLGAGFGVSGYLWLGMNDSRESLVAHENQATRTDFSLLSSLDPNLLQAAVFANALELPRDEFSKFVARHRSGTDDIGAVFGDLPKHIPVEILSDIRADRASDAHASAVAWLDRNIAALDAIARSLEKAAMSFPLAETDQLHSNGELLFTLDACLVIHAFVANAYLSAERQDVSRALDNLTSARLLAADLQFGPTTMHTAEGTVAHRDYYACVQKMLSEAIDTREGITEIAQWLLADPLIMDTHRDIAHQQAFLLQLARRSYSVDSNGLEYIDYHKLDAITDHHLSEMGVLPTRDHQLRNPTRPSDVRSLIARHLLRAKKWSTMDWDELTADIEIARSERNDVLLTEPLMQFFPAIGTGYQYRLLMRANRRALRLAAYLVMYETEHGHWPEELEDALPAGALNERLDDLSGEEFVVQFVDGIPQISSTTGDELPPDLVSLAYPDGLGAWIDDNTGQLVFFPALGSIGAHR